MLSEDLRSTLRAAPAPRRRLDRSVLLGAVVGVAIGLALVPWSAFAATITDQAAQSGAVPLVAAAPLAALAFVALALATRRRPG